MSKIDALSIELGLAHDAYATAVNALAVHTHAYELKFHQCLLKSILKSADLRKSEALTLAIAEYKSMLIGDALEKSSRRKIDVLLAQLTAEQSRLRFERNLT